MPLSIAIDQETGLVDRIGSAATVFPGAMALGAGRDEQATYDTYAITAAELRAMGITVDYAPDADVNVNPANPVIGVRSFSSDPELVATHVRAAVRGLQEQRLSAAAKHFPGHGDTGTDSHFGLPVIEHTRQQWEEIDAPPFRAAIEAGVDTIMTAHIAFPAFDDSGDPATLSRAVLSGLLRDELGFDGVIATDSLRMQGVRDKYGDARVPVLALQAGADVLLDPPQPDQQIRAVLDAVRTGELTEQRIEQSVARILAQKWRRGVIARPYVDEARVDAIVGTREHRARAQQITDHTTTLITDRAGLVPLPPGRVLVTGVGEDAVAAAGPGAERPRPPGDRAVSRGGSDEHRRCRRSRGPTRRGRHHHLRRGDRPRAAAAGRGPAGDRDTGGRGGTRRPVRHRVPARDRELPGHLLRDATRHHVGGEGAGRGTPAARPPSGGHPPGRQRVDPLPDRYRPAPLTAVRTASGRIWLTRCLLPSTNPRPADVATSGESS